jgi:hypothetical protein
MELFPHFSYIRDRCSVCLADTAGTSRNDFATKHFGSINTLLIINESHADIP